MLCEIFEGLKKRRRSPRLMTRSPLPKAREMPEIQSSSSVRIRNVPIWTTS